MKNKKVNHTEIEDYLFTLDFVEWVIDIVDVDDSFLRLLNRMMRRIVGNVHPNDLTMVHRSEL